MGFLNLFKRGSKIAEAKANASLDKMEDPTEMTTQAIRDLNVKLTNAVDAQATYKAMIIQLKSRQKEKETEKTVQYGSGRSFNRIDGSDKTDR